MTGGDPGAHRGDDRLVLRADGLCCTLGGRTVLAEVDLRVAAGEVVGLLGPNGAGKTTLFGLLMGLLRPASGAVTLVDSTGRRDITHLPTHLRARLGLGHLPQRGTLLRGLSVAQNLEVVAELNPGVAEGLDVGALLRRFGLASLAGQRASTLSGGEQRRLELARSLAARPRILLLDEPWKGLDTAAVGEVSEHLRHLAGEGIGVLITDHNVQQALTICRRTYILVGGRVLTSGTPGEVAGHPEARLILRGAHDAADRWSLGSPPGARP